MPRPCCLGELASPGVKGFYRGVLTYTPRPEVLGHVRSALSSARKARMVRADFFGAWATCEPTRSVEFGNSRPGGGLVLLSFPISRRKREQPCTQK